MNNAICYPRNEPCAGSMTAAVRPTPAPAQGEVESHLVELHSCTEDLAKNLAGLFERLMPVTRPANGGECGDTGKCPEPVKCALSEQIQRVTFMVRHLNSKVDDQKLYLAI